MKHLRVILLVVIMLSITLTIVITGGEEVQAETYPRVYQPPSKHGNISGEIQKIKSGQIPVLVQAIAIVEPDFGIVAQEHGVLAYSTTKKTSIYDDNREMHYQEELDERVQIILELTPLDAETAKVVLESADKFNVRPSLILGVMDLESNFGQFMVGTSQDRGYMQIIPGTEKWLCEAYGEELGITYNPENIFDADYNIPLATKYLQVLLKQYVNHNHKALTSYNRGHAGLKKWYAEHGTYETAYSRVVLKREQKYLEVK